MQTFVIYSWIRHLTTIADGQNNKGIQQKERMEQFESVNGGRGKKSEA